MTNPKEEHLRRWIGRAAGRHNLKIHTRFVDKRTMGQLYRYGAPYGFQSGNILTVRNDIDYDQMKTTLLHELAHVLVPIGQLNGKRRRNDIHSWVFWEMFWDLAEEEGMVEECRPYIYMKRGVKVYERRYTA